MYILISEGAVCKSMFTSHTQWVQAVRWSTTQDHLFMSGAYDNNVKLWDTRRCVLVFNHSNNKNKKKKINFNIYSSPKAPLFDLTGHEDKVLSCNWSNPKYLVSGGADNTVRIFKSKYAVK